jgi:Zn-finger nucleic acid-binding protein
MLDKITEDVDLSALSSSKMIRMVDIDQHCIWYEKCPACYGVWLDAGEFKNFKDNFQRSRNLLVKPRKFLDEKGNKNRDFCEDW